MTSDKTRFDLAGMQSMSKRVTVNVAQTSRADAALRVSARMT